jgi:adenylate cyclase
MATDTMGELVRAGSLLSNSMDGNTLISILVEQSLDVTYSDLACFYIFDNPESRTGSAELLYKRGRYDVPAAFYEENDLLDFLKDCKEAVVLLSKESIHFKSILLNPEMKSGIALPVFSHNIYMGILILNSRYSAFYNRDKFEFLDSFSALAAGMLHNAKLFNDLRNQLRYTEELERYQENIFSSMTNLLITLDPQGAIRYVNSAAAVRLNLHKDILGELFSDVMKKKLSKKILNSLQKAGSEDKELLGLEGIMKLEERDIDFSLNISPLRGKRGKDEGTVLLFTDQTRERELKEKIDVAVEERRIVKDMFSRYLSQDIVQNLMDKPELVQLGGAKKTATVFFADIRGYTSFAEGKEPEYIIEVLNEYFSEAVEVIINNNGYIDKFIGDCIMAAWGVPLMSEAEDAFSAVSCAYEIQKMVEKKDRKFFRGEAADLRIGIGIHSGPLVAGNLGSTRRMDYSVIGDTVNIASRLEGIAESGEIIITENTADLIEDSFSVKKLKAVNVKGKTDPVTIFKILDKK